MLQEAAACGMLTTSGDSGAEKRLVGWLQTKREDLTLFLIVCMIASVPVRVSGETEMAAAPSRSFSQYVWLDGNKWHMNLRLFNVAGPHGPGYGEIKVGPTLNLGSSLVKPSFGVTTDGSLTANLVVVRSRLVYIADPLWYHNRPTVFFHKAFLRLTDSFFLRAEQLRVGSDEIFLRVGPEWRHRQSGFALSPFIDVPSRKLGLFTTWRF